MTENVIISEETIISICMNLKKLENSVSRLPILYQLDGSYLISIQCQDFFCEDDITCI